MAYIEEKRIDKLRRSPSGHSATSHSSGYTQMQRDVRTPATSFTREDNVRKKPATSFTREDNVRRKDEQEQVGRAIQRLYNRAKGGRGGGTR